VKAAIYARVSTADQHCEMQLSEIRDYAQRRGWEIHREYVDTGWSGAKASRPELDRLMKDAQMRHFDVVIVWKLDRWGRSVANCLSTIQQLTQVGIRWIALTQNLDTDESNPMSRFMLTILAAVAEFEREMIRERVRAGMKAAKHRGKICGRPKRVFDRTAVTELKAAGLSIRDIAKKLGLGKGTVARLLSAA
jgi:putative DNA-invertase from lambdoid prophage Rac